MLEEKIAELIEVIAANTKALQDAYGTTHVTNTKQEVPHGTSSVETDPPKKTAKKKSSKKKAAKKQVEPVTEQSVESEQPASEPELPTMDVEKVRSHLQAINAQLNTEGALRDLIVKHGAQKFSDLDPSVYPALVEDAEQLVRDGK